MSKHHHHDRCRERHGHRRHCDERMYLAYPMGAMPGFEPSLAPNPYSPSENVEAMQGYGGSCFMTPTGPVCPGTGGGSCFMGPGGMVCPGTGAGGSCFMTPQGRVCPSQGYDRTY